MKNKLFVYVGALFILWANAASSDVWRLHGSCIGTGCGAIRASSLPEYCMAQQELYNNYMKSKYNYSDPRGKPALRTLTGIVMTVTGESYWPTPYSNGSCQWNNRPGLTTGGTALWSGCPAGAKFDAQSKACVEVKRPKCSVGNPIEIDTGIKVQEEVDYVATFDTNKFSVARYYRSRNNFSAKSFHNTNYGGYWNITFSDRLNHHVIQTGYTTYETVKIFIPESLTQDYFLSSDGSWSNRNGSMAALEKLTINGLEQWRLTSESGVVKFFDLQGRLSRIKYPAGHVVDAVYRDPTSSDSFTYVDFISNGSIIFTYKYNGLLLNEILNAEQATVSSYSYDALGNLVSVGYPGGVSKVYHYEDVNYFKALTGITDERGVRYATWTYDAQGRATSSQHAGGADNTLLAFNADGSTTVTNPLGKQTTYHFADIGGARRVTQVQGHATTSCEGANQNYTYTPEGWIASKTDWKGHVTTYSYNSKGQEISRIEASGTPQARTITSEWHPTLEQKTRVVEGNKETLYAYDTAGRLLTTTINSLPAQQAN